MMTEFDKIVDQLRGAVASASLDPRMSDDDLRDILAFLVKVTQVVDQTFQDVLTLAIEASYLSPQKTSYDRLERLQVELDLLTTRSHYRESLEICSRLKHLKEQFERHIRPAIAILPDADRWRELFWLIEEREGRIIAVVEQAAWQLRAELDQARGGHIGQVNTVARQLVDTLRPLLSELRELTNRLLGLSGRQGFLELTNDRSALRQAVNLVVRQGDYYMSGDIYKTGIGIGVGRGAQATNVTVNQNYGAVLQGMDLPTLAQQLGQLKEELRKQAQSTEQFLAITAVSGAHDAADSNQPSAAVEKLKGVGSWALDVATKIGCTVAAEAIKKASGLG